jgi:hypothetical protein
VLSPSGVPLRIFRASALPRIFWVGAFTVSASAGDAVLPALLRAARGDTVVLSDALPLASGAAEGPVTAEAVSIGESTTSARIVAPRDGIVVILDPWFPGWEAELDGRPVELRRANYAFQAVVVPGGAHQLELTYRSRGLRWGLAAALVGGLLLVVVASRTRGTRDHRDVA